MINSHLQKARELLYHKTPLGFYNCGRLCDGLCCRGDCKGMWLYPHEAEFYENKDGFELCEAQGNNGYPLLLCSGECDRRERPLACRIFPLFPLVTEENGRVRVRVVIDPRAGICPLAHGEKQLDRNFVRAVRRAAYYLIADKETFEYMKAVSLELLEIIELRDRLK